jgi:hypothetical protein
MEKILNSLKIGDILYVTTRGTQYKLKTRKSNCDIIYSINRNQKTLPYKTIQKAYEDSQNNIIIDRPWYNAYNLLESTTRPCNLSVLKTLIARVY